VVRPLFFPARDGKGGGAGRRRRESSTGQRSSPLDSGIIRGATTAGVAEVPGVAAAEGSVAGVPADGRFVGAGVVDTLAGGAIALVVADGGAFCSAFHSFHLMNSQPAAKSQAISRKERVWFIGRLSSGAQGACQESMGDFSPTGAAGGIVPGATDGFNDMAALSSNFNSAARRPGLSTLFASGLAWKT